MAEQDILYIAMLTEVGAAQLAKSIANGTPWKIPRMAVGDGNGVTPLPSKLQKKLINEKLRFGLNRLTVQSEKSAIVAEGILLPEMGGWWVREVGLYDDAGLLIAVASYPATYKPVREQGSGRTQVIRLVIQISSTATVQIINDPNTVTATLGVVQEAIDQGEAASARKLKTPRTIALTGDATGQGQFDGTAALSIALALSKTGVAGGTYTKVTVDDKGRVKSAGNLAAADIPALDATKITSGTLDRNTTGNAGTATKLQTARKISYSGDLAGNGLFDGSGNVDINLTLGNSGVAAGSYGKVRVNAKGLVVEGLALTAADIPALDASKITTGTLSRPTTGNAGSATKWQNPRALTFSGAATGGGWMDGTGNLDIGLTLAGLDASAMVSGQLPLWRGGTGGWDAASARANIGAASPASLWHSANGFWWDKNTGLFVQWGVRELGDMPGGMWNVAFGFNWGFDTAPFILIPVITQLAGGRTAAATVTCAMNEGSLTTAGFTLSFTEHDQNVQNFGVRWLAVGYRLTPM
ncbi:phage tail protein [Pseudomonas sp. QTF5]|uniref:phage tail protein n=1 Tax=Pseudomonas sp. QTF5 TaxID=1435425 RepID=UPI0004B91481|nr:phage tail protein [Pseudomonas sp. QTF5]